MIDHFLNIDYQYDKLIRAVEKLDKKDKILSALELAKESHKDQKRDEGQDYFIHPIRIVNCLIYELDIKDSNLLISALLHDVVEDSEMTLGEINKKFGKKVEELVNKLTRNKDKETKREKFNKLMKESDEVRLIKTVDWLDNLRSFPYRKDRGERYCRHLKEASEMYLPLAQSINNYLTSEMKKIIKKFPKIKS